MLDDDTLALLPSGFDLAAATKKAVEQAVSGLIPMDRTAAMVASVDLTGTVHLGVAVRVGDHLQIYGDLAGHITTRQFTGQLRVVGTW